MRLIDLRQPSLFVTRERYAPAGTARSRAVGKIIRQLGEDVMLPGLQDVTKIIPPVRLCFARPVPKTGLLVCYTFDDARVRIIAIMGDAAPMGR